MKISHRSIYMSAQDVGMIVLDTITIAMEHQSMSKKTEKFLIAKADDLGILKDKTDIVSDLCVVDNDPYLRNVPNGKAGNKPATLSLDESATPPEDPLSEFLNLNDLVSSEDFPAVSTVPAVHIKSRHIPETTRSWQPNHQRTKYWTQRKAYEIFMGCLEWLRSAEDHYFPSEYWASQGIVDRSLAQLELRYPICKNVGEQIRSTQEAKLLKGAATEKLHPGFIKFYLNCRFQDKYVPRTESKAEVTGTGVVAAQQVQVTFSEVVKELKPQSQVTQSQSQAQPQAQVTQVTQVTQAEFKEITEVTSK